MSNLLFKCLSKLCLFFFILGIGIIVTFASEKQDSTFKKPDTTNTKKTPGNSSHDKRKGYDTLYRCNGSVARVTIKSVNEKEIQFCYPDSRFITRLATRLVQKICYSDGIQSQFECAADSTRDWISKSSHKAWEDVLITSDVNQVAGMVEKGPVEIEWVSEKITSDNDFLEKNAEMVLRKKAYKLKANTILIVQKTFTRNYGELPSIILKGVAYTNN